MAGLVRLIIFNVELHSFAPCALTIIFKCDLNMFFYTSSFKSLLEGICLVDWLVIIAIKLLYIILSYRHMTLHLSLLTVNTRPFINDTLSDKVY